MASADVEEKLEIASEDSRTEVEVGDSPVPGAGESSGGQHLENSSDDQPHPPVVSEPEESSSPTAIRKARLGRLKELHQRRVLY